MGGNTHDISPYQSCLLRVQSILIIILSIVLVAWTLTYNTNIYGERMAVATVVPCWWHWEFWRLPCLCSLEIGHYPLYENRRGPLGKIPCTFLGSCKLIIYRVWILGVRSCKFFVHFLWRKLPGVVIHEFPVVLGCGYTWMKMVINNPNLALSHWRCAQTLPPHYIIPRGVVYVRCTCTNGVHIVVRLTVGLERTLVSVEYED